MDLRKWTRSRSVFVAPIFWILAGCLGPSHSTHGTVVVALLDKRNSTLILGADSLVRYQKSQRTFNRCKLLKCGTYGFVTMAGLYDKPMPHFDLADLIAKSCRISKSLQEASDYFLKSSKEPFEAVTRYIRIQEPGIFQNSRMIEAIFAGSLNGHPRLLARGWHADDAGHLEPEADEINRSVVSIECCFFSGEYDHILSYIKSHPKWEAMGYLEAARLFLNMETTASPYTAGGPISILAINNLGRPHWVDQGVCPALQ
jgi:hypothetical protein